MLTRKMKGCFHFRCPFARLTQKCLEAGTREPADSTRIISSITGAQACEEKLHTTLIYYLSLRHLYEVFFLSRVKS